MKFKSIVLFIMYSIYSCSCETVNPAKFIKEKGYPVDEYTVQTDDGYLLKLYRIPRGINSTTSETNNRKAVLLVHGLAANAACFVTFNPNRSLGYILADKGYDVWLLNVRGTSTSNKHIYYDPKTDAKEFFNFSWHEIGIYDLPATIDFILNKTNENQLQYIGHSQGATAFLVMTSMRPEYNSKIRLASLLAPPIFMRRVDPLVQLIAVFHKPIYIIGNHLNIYHTNGVDGFRKRLELLSSHKIFYPFCMLYYDLLLGYADHVQVKMDDLIVIYRGFPTDVSFKQLNHYLQIISSGKFHQFDYGYKRNLNIYSSEVPPDYNLESVTSPIALFVGKNDHFSNAKDVTLLGGVLRNVTKLNIINYKYFNHGDFVAARDVVKLLYVDLMNHMALY